MSRPNDASVRYIPAQYQNYNYNEQLSRFDRIPSQRSSRSPSPRRSGDRDRYGPRRRRYSSRSRSRSRSPPSRRRDSRVNFAPTPEKQDKPWYKKKTLWATLASVATIASIVPITYSAHGSLSSAKGSNRSADASHRAADSVEKSARAAMRSADASHRAADSVEKSSRAAIRSADAAEQSADASGKAAIAALRSASAVEKSTKAATYTAMANGHMDADGNYIPPAKPKPLQAPMRDQRLLDYEPLRKVFNAADMVTGHAKAR
ncbi:hypothetical protein AC579_7208 [Pseudocercospora musae]|uniref:Uncharacterized protein n=1 Tax=Pseudocercospora musae TaxID=113226 RepID=A0A139H8Y1_9PEZI|nr:hypothetical protein AC579_7208 [Pseudocercospora musae]KXS98897.1 hypothetical protein AC579_7208 [Pseudocercospora musae]KXS98899.1 hypothetical protein AC579_7208 [Pseudocercospora musae]